jgi:methionyl-tRNA formyltransferase
MRDLNADYRYHGIRTAVRPAGVRESPQTRHNSIPPVVVAEISGPSSIKGKAGEISEIGRESIHITAQGGQIEVMKLKHEDGKKMSASDFLREAGVGVGTLLGN